MVAGAQQQDLVREGVVAGQALQGQAAQGGDDKVVAPLAAELAQHLVEQFGLFRLQRDHDHGVRVFPEPVAPCVCRHTGFEAVTHGGLVGEREQGVAAVVTVADQDHGVLPERQAAQDLTDGIACQWQQEQHQQPAEQEVTDGPVAIHGEQQGGVQAGHEQHAGEDVAQFIPERAPYGVVRQRDGEAIEAQRQRHGEQGRADA